MAERAQQARDLAEREAFDDAVGGALSYVRQENWSQSIRDSDGLKSFGAIFKAPAEGGGWFNLFLIAIAREFKTDAEFKRLWDSVQLSGISAMLLDDIKLSGERHDELKHVISRWGDELGSSVAAVKTVVDDISRQQARDREANERFHKETHVLLRKVAPLRAVLEKLGAAHVATAEIRSGLPPPPTNCCNFAPTSPGFATTSRNSRPFGAKR
jgi:hypothetical protein